MINATSSELTARFDELYSKARGVLTFSTRWHEPLEIRDEAKKTTMYFDNTGRGDTKIHNCPLLLIKIDNSSNRVMMRSPINIWVDVSDATAAELQDVAMGLVADPAKQLSTANVEPAAAVGELVGLLFNAFLSGRKSV